MTGAAGDSPGTAGTDPLVAVVAETIHATGLCERTSVRYGSRTFNRAQIATCTGACNEAAVAALAAVRAHLDATTQKAAAQALRDAADALPLPEDNWPEAPHNCRTHDLDVAEWLRNRADTLEMS